MFQWIGYFLPMYGILIHSMGLLCETQLLVKSSLGAKVSMRAQCILQGADSWSLSFALEIGHKTYSYVQPGKCMGMYHTSKTSSWHKCYQTNNLSEEIPSFAKQKSTFIRWLTMLPVLEVNSKSLENDAVAKNCDVIILTSHLDIFVCRRRETFSLPLDPCHSI